MPRRPSSPLPLENHAATPSDVSWHCACLHGNHKRGEKNADPPIRQTVPKKLAPRSLNPGGNTEPASKPFHRQKVARKKIGGREGRMFAWTLTHDHPTRVRSPLKLDQSLRQAVRCANTAKSVSARCAQPPLSKTRFLISNRTLARPRHPFSRLVTLS